MSYLFQNKETFNDDTSNWNVSNVTDMTGMFQNASTFNQSLALWDVSNVTSVNYMLTGSGYNRNGELNSWGNVLLGQIHSTY